MFLQKKGIRLSCRISTRLECEVCELKKESPFAHCLFGEVAPSPHYSEGSGDSVLLLLSDESPLQEYLTEP